MRYVRQAAVGLVAAAVVGFGWGCGSGAPPVETSMDEATVSGSVTIKGKRATKGEVTFDPSNSARTEPARSAPITEDGTYTIKTLIGQNRIRVSAPEVKGRASDDVELYFDVQPGTNTYDIVLPPPE
jgi:hypothetical protein